MLKDTRELSEETEKLNSENKRLQKQLEEAKESIEAFKQGKIDALIIADEKAHKILTDQTADKTYRILIEKMHEGAATLNKDGIILYCNLRFADMVGRPLQKIIGTEFKTYIDPSSVESYENLFKQGWNGYSQEEIFIRTGDDKIIAMLMSVNILSLENDSVLTIIVTDITARKKAAEEKIQLLLSEQKIKELENFTYIISHDVLAPLRNVAALSKIFSADYSDKVDEQGKEYLRLMNEKISLLAAMIDEVLVYIRAGKTSSERTLVDTHALVKDIIKLQSTPTKKRELILDNTLPTIFASKTTMKQVFTNFIDNAIKHNDKDEVIVHIGCVDKKDYWEFYVKDNGPGIPKAFQAKMFQIFQTLKPKDEAKSTGIGLATVKRGVESEGGKIWIESEPGKGTTFFFTIKKTEDTAPSDNKK